MRNEIRSSSWNTFLTIAIMAFTTRNGLAQVLAPPTSDSGQPRATVAVADFDFHSEDDTLAYLQKGVPAMMCTDISQVRSLDVLARKTMLDEIRKEQKLAEDGLIDKKSAVMAGKLLGARFLLGGAVHVDGNRLRLDAQVVDVETGRVFFSTTASGSKDEASTLEAQLAEQVAESMCSSLGVDLSDRERLAVRGERKGGFDSFALYSKAAIAQRAGENEKARQIFNEVMNRRADAKNPSDAGVAALRAATSSSAPPAKPDAKEPIDRPTRLDKHKARWQAWNDGATHDARWLASPIILSTHAGLAGDFEQERRLLGEYWARFTKHVQPANALATANEMAAIIRLEEEFFRATVDAGDYSGVPDLGDPDDNVHADLGDGVRWPRFSKLWPFDLWLRTSYNAISYAKGENAELVKSSFMASLPQAPHDYLENVISLRDAIETLHPDAENLHQAGQIRKYLLLSGETLALCGDVIGYCTQIPNPPEKMITGIQNLHYGFLNGLDKLPATVEPTSLGREFLSRTVPVLDALSKTAPKRDHRELAARLLTRFGRQMALTSENGVADAPGSQKSAVLFGIPVTTSRVLIVWHEDEAIDIDASKQETMARHELADFILALPASTRVNVLLALGNVVTPDQDAQDEWLLENPVAANAETKKKLLEALDPESRGKRFAKGTLTNAIQSAIDASRDNDSTVLIVRLRNDSKIESPLDPSLAEKRPQLTMHAVLSAETPELAALIRGHRGSLILLENDGDFVFGKVQKRVIDTTKD
jgi:TolB-like protein